MTDSERLQSPRAGDALQCEDMEEINPRVPRAVKPEIAKEHVLGAMRSKYIKDFDTKLTRLNIGDGIDGYEALTQHTERRETLADHMLVRRELAASCQWLVSSCCCVRTAETHFSSTLEVQHFQCSARSWGGDTRTHPRLLNESEGVRHLIGALCVNVAHHVCLVGSRTYV